MEWMWKVVYGEPSRMTPSLVIKAPPDKSGAFIERRLVWGCGGENEALQLGRAECQAFETLSRDVVHPATY